MRLLLLILFILLVSTTANADCISAFSKARGVDEVPSIFGAPWNVYGSSTPSISATGCGKGETTATIIGGTGEPTQYINEIGYYWNGYEWCPFDLIGNEAIDSNWYRGSVSSTDVINVNSNTYTYVALGICTVVNNVSKCGCRDTNCTGNIKWTIQGIKSDPPEVVPPSSQCSSSQVPGIAAAAGLTSLAFCDDFSTNTVASGDTAAARDITGTKKWTTERATGWGGTPDPTSSFKFNADGTLSIIPVYGTYQWSMTSTVVRNGVLKGYWLKKKSKWYVEIRWKFEANGATNRQPAFWSMDTCHLYGLPAACPGTERVYVEPDFWEYVQGNSRGLHYYWENPPGNRYTCGGGFLAAPGENTWFTAGHLYDGAKQQFTKNNVVYYTRTAGEACSGGGGTSTAGFIFNKMLVGDYPILIGAKPTEKITIDFVRVWVAP